MSSAARDGPMQGLVRVPEHAVVDHGAWLGQTADRQLLAIVAAREPREPLDRVDGNVHPDQTDEAQHACQLVCLNDRRAAGTVVEPAECCSKQRQPDANTTY
jgi:hypothetical protein